MNLLAFGHTVIAGRDYRGKSEHCEKDKFTQRPADGEMGTYTTTSQKGRSRGKFCFPKKNSTRGYRPATFPKGCSVNAVLHNVISLQPSLPPAQQFCWHILVLPKLTTVKPCCKNNPQIVHACLKQKRTTIALRGCWKKASSLCSLPLWQEAETVQIHSP